MAQLLQKIIIGLVASTLAGVRTSLRQLVIVPLA
jgi:hypothetical protein